MVKILDSEFIYVVFIGDKIGTLIEQSTDGFNVAVRRNHKFKPEQWTKEWKEISQSDYYKWLAWLFDWVFTHEIKDEPPGAFIIK